MVADRESTFLNDMDTKDMLKKMRTLTSELTEAASAVVIFATSGWLMIGASLVKLTAAPKTVGEEAMKATINLAYIVPYSDQERGLL